MAKSADESDSDSFMEEEQLSEAAKKSDFNTFVKENIKNQLEKKERINKMMIYKAYLNDEYELGKGSFGKVYEVK